MGKHKVKAELCQVNHKAVAFNIHSSTSPNLDECSATHWLRIKWLRTHDASSDWFILDLLYCQRLLVFWLGTNFRAFLGKACFSSWPNYFVSWAEPEGCITMFYNSMFQLYPLYGNHFFCSDSKFRYCYDGCHQFHTFKKCTSFLCLEVFDFISFFGLFIYINNFILFLWSSHKVGKESI